MSKRGEAWDRQGQPFVGSLVEAVHRGDRVLLAGKYSATNQLTVWREEEISPLAVTKITLCIGVPISDGQLRTEIVCEMPTDIILVPQENTPSYVVSRLRSYIESYYKIPVIDVVPMTSSVSFAR